MTLTPGCMGDSGDRVPVDAIGIMADRGLVTVQQVPQRAVRRKEGAVPMLLRPVELHCPRRFRGRSGLSGQV